MDQPSIADQASVAIRTALVGWLTSGKFAIYIAALALIAAGVVSIRALKEQSPLAPYALQILGLLFITPVLLLLSATTEIKSEVVTGLLGTIIRYIFGTAKVTQGSPTPRNSRDA